MVRKEKKDHGTSKLIEGDMNSGDNIIVVEDVITSAGSSIAAVGTLRENGASVNEIISVIDRESGGKEALSAIGITLISLTKASELLKGEKKGEER
jgi:orotate phosphoribosyltransferase